MSILSVLIAAAACWGIGAIYYTVLSKAWLDALGKTKDEISGGSATPFIISLIAQIIAVGMMRHVFFMSGIDSIGAGTIAGAGVGAFLIGSWIFVNNAFENKSLKLSAINTGYSTLGMMAAGAVLGYFL